MHHHAFYALGSIEEVQNTLGAHNIPQTAITVLTYGLFSVEDARKVAELASRTSANGGVQALVIVVDRLFHEAQNALLKTFEEPPEGMTLVLVVPSVGVIIPTLRSRLLPLNEGKRSVISPEAALFVAAGKEERMKIVEKLITRSKADGAEEKNAARRDALRLAEGILRSAHATRGKNPSSEIVALLSDLDHFIPLMNDRAAPLKPILEHIAIVCPSTLPTR